MSIVGEWQPAGEFNPNNYIEGDRFLICYKDLKPLTVQFTRRYEHDNEELSLLLYVGDNQLDVNLNQVKYFAKINPPC